MSQKEDAVVSEYSGESFTKVTFFPDLTKFKMQELEKDIVSLMTKRAYDLAGITNSKVSVFLNS